ncbi:MAG: hypothetical protein IJZ74_12360 [Clostridia bacterium]|nr:hypothetical protein [Clostridia bacterium]
MSAAEQTAMPLWKRVIRSILTAVASLLLIVVFYVAVIMGQPQDDGAAVVEARMDQPLLSAMSSALLITSESDMSYILEAFPAPVMYASYGNALTFVQGLCSDISFENGLGRVVTLTYLNENGDEMTVASIYPARALSLMGKGDYTISGTAGLSLAGLRSVRMENAGSVRMHAQGTDALYVVTTPKLDAAVLRQLTAALQLLERAAQ